MNSPNRPLPLNEQAVRTALLGVIDPELGDNVVELGMVRGIKISETGEVVIEFALTIAGCPLRTQLRNDVETRVSSLPGVTKVKVNMGEMSPEERSAVMARARWKVRENSLDTDISPSTRVVAIASGKGGVGKSSVTVNLAAALAKSGQVVGVLDADIWGFSVPRMLGMEGEIPVAQKKMQPLEKPVGDGLLKVLSMGFLSGEDEAIMWRGLMLNRALQHFLEDVHWGDMNYLFVDMPPGTGDVQMGLARMLPRAEMIIVTTPALAAQKVAARAADMARRGYLRIAGVVENMTSFTCDDGTEYHLFGEGGGQRLSEEIGVPLLGQIPLDPVMATGADEGVPAVLGKPGNVSRAFEALADEVLNVAIPPVEMSTCTAQVVEQMQKLAAAAKA